MTNNFWIKYEIERVDCSLPPDDTNGSYEGFVAHAIKGKALIGFGEKSVPTGPCGLLQLSRSLIRLCTFPVLYSMEAFETVLDRDIDFRSVARDENIIFTITEGHKSRLVFEVPLREALQAVGAFHRDLLMKLFEACPPIREHGLLLIRIPDAFALAHTSNPDG